MYRVLVIALVLILAGLQYRLWIGDGSWAQAYHVNQMRENLHAKNVKARARNNAMQAEIDDLKSGDLATEGRARSEMGMVKRNETFFLTVPNKESSDPVAAATPP